jgi:hypothetical protein
MAHLHPKKYFHYYHFSEKDFYWVLGVDVFKLLFLILINILGKVKESQLMPKSVWAKKRCTSWKLIWKRHTQVEPVGCPLSAPFGFNPVFSRRSQICQSSSEVDRGFLTPNAAWCTRLSEHPCEVSALDDHKWSRWKIMKKITATIIKKNLKMTNRMYYDNLPKYSARTEHYRCLLPN